MLNSYLFSVKWVFGYKRPGARYPSRGHWSKFDGELLSITVPHRHLISLHCFKLEKNIIFKKMRDFTLLRLKGVDTDDMKTRVPM